MAHTEHEDLASRLAIVDALPATVPAYEAFVAG